MDEWVGGWMGGRTDGRTDGRMDGRTDEWVRMGEMAISSCAGDEMR